MKGRALGVALLCACGAVAAQDDTADERSFKESMALTAYSKVEYRDQQGKPIPFDAFMKQAASGESAFSIKKDTETKQAWIALEKKTKKTFKPNGNIKAGADFPRPAGKTLDGRTVDSAMPPGRYALLSFFFADCAPCIKEIPALNAYAQAHPETSALAITFDPEEEARKFAWQNGFKWPVLADSKPYLERIKMAVYPTLVLVGPDGKVAARHSGAMKEGEVLSLESLEAWVDAAQAQ